MSELTIGQEGTAPTANTTIKFTLTELYTGEGDFYGGLTLDNIYLKNLVGFAPDPADQELSYDESTGEYTYTTGEPLTPTDTYELQIAIEKFNPYTLDETETFTFVQPAYT